MPTDETTSLLELKEDHVFVETSDSTPELRKLAISGFLVALPEEKVTQCKELMAVCNFEPDRSVMDFLLNPNVVTRIWFAQAISEYNGKAGL